MKFYHKYIVCFVGILCLLSQAVFALTPDEIVGTSAVLIDGESGQVLFDKNSNTPMFPASTTKVMTALLILEDCSLKDLVTVDASTPYTGGSSIYLREGEQLTVEQLLHAMLLSSANDAAVALAKYHSGTVEAFVDRMNQRAKALGAKNTHFDNPNGLPDSTHVTSTYDLSLIAREAMKHEVFRKMVTTVSYKIIPTNKQNETRYLRNSNRMLFGTGPNNKINLNGQDVDIKWNLVDGIKTGYTTVADQCLVASASKEGRRVISVVFKSKGKDIYKDSRLLLEYGLGQFENKQIAKMGTTLGQIDLPNKKALIPVAAASNLAITLAAGTSITVPKPELIASKNLKLPIREGQVVGVAQYKMPNGVILTAPIKALKSYDEFNLWHFLTGWMKAPLTLLILVGKTLLGILVLLLFRAAFVNYKRKRRRRRRTFGSKI